MTMDYKNQDFTAMFASGGKAVLLVSKSYVLMRISPSFAKVSNQLSQNADGFQVLPYQFESTNISASVSDLHAIVLSSGFVTTFGDNRKGQVCRVVLNS